MRIGNSQFEIGAFKFRGCTQVRIKKSIHNYRDSARIILPTTARLKSDAPNLPSRQTAKQFEVGDKVDVKLGYDGDLRQEFKGFVSQVNFGEPVEIECEGYSWLLRNKCTLTASWASTTLKQVLQRLIDVANAEQVADDKISLHPDIPNIPLKNIVINSATGTQVIDYIKGLFNGILQAFFVGRQLYMGLSYTDISRKKIKYRLNWNTLPPRSLRYKRADEVKVKVEIKYRNKSGKQITTSTGKEGGVVRRDNLTVVTNDATIKKIAEAKLLQESFDGYEGSITGQLFPYCQPGDTAILEDAQYHEREGDFFVESVSVDYGYNADYRTVELGQRLN